MRIENIQADVELERIAAHAVRQKHVARQRYAALQGARRQNEARLATSLHVRDFAFYERDLHIFVIVNLLGAEIDNFLRLT
jgi:hypothetical protein